MPCATTADGNLNCAGVDVTGTCTASGDADPIDGLIAPFWADLDPGVGLPENGEVSRGLHSCNPCGEPRLQL